MHRFERWRDVLQAADSIDAVEAILREYRGSISPALVTVLPADCRKAIEQPDAHVAAVTLRHAELAHRGSDELARLLHEIAQTYATAAMRISKLKRDPAGE